MTENNVWSDDTQYVMVKLPFKQIKIIELKELPEFMRGSSLNGAAHVQLDLNDYTVDDIMQHHTTGSDVRPILMVAHIVEDIKCEPMAGLPGVWLVVHTGMVGHMFAYRRQAVVTDCGTSDSAAQTYRQRIPKLAITAPGLDHPTLY